MPSSEGPFALRAHRMRDGLTGAPFGLLCSECPRGHRCDEWPAEGTGYPFEGARELGDAAVNWGGKCPASYLRDYEYIAGLQHYRWMRVQGLPGWPHDYPAWLTDYVTEIAERQTVRQRESDTQSHRDMLAMIRGQRP